MAMDGRRKGIRFWLVACGFAVLLCLAVPDAWVYLSGAPRMAPPPPGFAPALILVPGASVLRNGKPSPVLRQRVETALGAARRWPAARLVLSGTAEGGYDEPASMFRYLLDHGVDSARMLLDRKGTSTWASVENLGRPAGPVLVVSQAWHLPRACWLARGNGWDVRGLAAGEGGAQGWENLAREHMVRVANFWGRTPKAFSAASR